MGVYHLMGLGTSPGAVTAPLSYLAHRYQRWNSEDVKFFEFSGEASRRAQGKKAGDIQALVIFTISEVLGGKILSRPYIENQPGNTHGKLIDNPLPLKDVLRSLLPPILRDISHRKTIDLFWCEIDRRNIRNVYERIIRVVAALSGVGGEGKEMWANLTGGNNVTNFALELAATLSGQIARLYYVHAQNDDAEKCVHFAAEHNYWVDLPVMPLQMGRLSHAILKIISTQPGLSEKDLYGNMLNHHDYWNLVHGISLDVFKENYLVPLWKQRLILSEQDSQQSPSYRYYIGPQWQVIQPYETEWQQARSSAQTIQEIARQNHWLTYEPLNL
jgi:hypothetical protein